MLRIHRAKEFGDDLLDVIEAEQLQDLRLICHQSDYCTVDAWEVVQWPTHKVTQPFCAAMNPDHHETTKALKQHFDDGDYGDDSDAALNERVRQYHLRGVQQGHYTLEDMERWGIQCFAAEVATCPCRQCRRPINIEESCDEDDSSSDEFSIGERARLRKLRADAKKRRGNRAKVRTLLTKTRKIKARVLSEEKARKARVLSEEKARKDALAVLQA